MSGSALALAAIAFSCCIAAVGQGVPHSAATLSMSANDTHADGNYTAPVAVASGRALIYHLRRSESGGGWPLAA